MSKGKWVAIAVVLILVPIAALSVVYSSSVGNFLSQSLSNSSSTANSFSTSTTTSTFSGTSGAVISANSFTYSSSSTIKVLSVRATVSGGAGNQFLSFNVEFQNIGSAPIYIQDGGGSPLSATILSGPVQEVRTVQCEIVTGMIPISPGQTDSVFTPGCWSGYNYVLSQPATIQVLLNLTWYNGSYSRARSMQITAEFTLN